MRKTHTRVMALLGALALTAWGTVACSHDSGGGGGSSEERGSLTHGPLTTERVARIALPEQAPGTVELKQGATSLYSGPSLTEAFGKIPASGDCEITLSPGAYKVEGLNYKGSATIKIKGTGSAKYGMDVLIYGQGTNMKEESTRSTLSFEGSCNIILENLAIENTYRETKGDAQAETLGVGSSPFSGTLAAYNCAFISGQDTICTEGKAWFYDCYIEGDVDFLWMEKYSSKVALYENCRIRATSGRAERAYFTAPRLAVANTVGKGVVIWKSTLEAEDGFKEVFLGRNPWDEDNDKEKNTNYFKDYYEQVAIVGTKYYGPALSGAVWSGSGANGTPNQQFVGFKTDSNFAKSSSGVGARLTAAQVSAEYSDRNAILNRMYNVAEEKFENDAASGIWNIAALESEFGSGASGGLEQEVFNEKSAKVTWDLASAWTGDDSTTAKYEGSSGKIIGTVNGSDAYMVKMHVNAVNGKFAADSGNNRTQMNAGTVLTVPVTNGSIVAVTANSGTFGIEGKTTTTYTHSGGATGIVIYCTANGYITEVAVSKLDLTALDDGLKNATATGSVRAIALGDSAKEIMNGNTYKLAVTQYTSYGAGDETVSWTTDNAAVASVSNGTVTANASSGTATITATVNGHSATCNITAVPKTEVSKYTFDFSTNFSGTVAATEDTSKTLTVGSGISHHGSTYGAKGTGTVQFPVPGNCTVTFYPTYKMVGTVTLYKSGDTSTQLGTASIDISSVDAKIGSSGTQEPSQYAKKITYTGDAQMVDLVIAGDNNVYFWKIVVEKTN